MLVNLIAGTLTVGMPTTAFTVLRKAMAAGT